MEEDFVNFIYFWDSQIVVFPFEEFFGGPPKRWPEASNYSNIRPHASKKKSTVWNLLLIDPFMNYELRMAQQKY